jgi:predicted 2-oxoglutarate/Fe(II)-dependent dioxygenase YbiX
MEIKNFIKIYDDVLPLNVLSNLIRYINTVDFQEAKIVGTENNKHEVNFNIRRTFNYSLEKISNSLSNVHWYSLLKKLFNSMLKSYAENNNIKDFPLGNVTDITVLKYENTGFYTWHTDHCTEVPRTMSCILLLNNDYEGGNLCFRNPDGSGEWEVEVRPNRMIIWPSNFLYPHTVKPVTKGKRYSVVAWAL